MMTPALFAIEFLGTAKTFPELLNSMIFELVICPLFSCGEHEELIPTARECADIGFEIREDMSSVGCQPYRDRDISSYLLPVYPVLNPTQFMVANLASKRHSVPRFFWKRRYS